MLDGLTITEIELTDSAASDILETALEAGHTFGYGYWANTLGITRNDNRQVTAIKLEDTEGTPMKICSVFDKNRHIGNVTLTDVKFAVQDMLRDPKATDSASWTSRLVDDSQLDGPLAEAIIQVACFGKVIYG